MLNSQLQHTLEKVIELFKNDQENTRVIFLAQTYLVNDVFTYAPVRKFNFNAYKQKEMAGINIAQFWILSHTA